MFRPNLKSVASPIPEIIAIGILGGVANPNPGKKRPQGSGMVPSKERW